MRAARLCAPLAGGRMGPSPAREPRRHLDGTGPPGASRPGAERPARFSRSPVRPAVRTQVPGPLLHPNRRRQTALTAHLPRRPAAPRPGSRASQAPPSRALSRRWPSRPLRRRPPRPPTPPRPSSPRPPAQDVLPRPPEAGTRHGGIGVPPQRRTQRGGFTSANASPPGTAPRRAQRPGPPRLCPDPGPGNPSPDFRACVAALGGGGPATWCSSAALAAARARCGWARRGGREKWRKTTSRVGRGAEFPESEPTAAWWRQEGARGRTEPPVVSDSADRWTNSVPSR